MIGARMFDPMAASRRLVPVFAADVEGYSRLMGAAEVGTLAVLEPLLIDGAEASRTPPVENRSGVVC